VSAANERGVGCSSFETAINHSTPRGMYVQSRLESVRRKK
jgi:hypothetical protein